MKKWITKDGAKIPIKQLEDSHLLNIIKMLERVHQNQISMGYSALSMMSGEMACYYAEQDIDRMHTKQSDHPLYDDLVAEAIKRKLLKD